MAEDRPPPSPRTRARRGLLLCLLLLVLQIVALVRYWGLVQGPVNDKALLALSSGVGGFLVFAVLLMLGKLRETKG